VSEIIDTPDEIQETNEATPRPHPIHVVLCRPSHPGNIGAAVRALHVMGMDGIRLVEPWEFPHAEASRRATGAEPVLSAATVHATLEDAVQDCLWVVGMSARRRHEGPPPLDIQVALREAARAKHPKGGIALVFGNERSGLTNEELTRCNVLATIPTGPDMSSLNLGAAVQVACYEMLRALGAADTEDFTASDEVPAARGSVDAWIAKLWEALQDRPELPKDDPRIPRMRERLRRLLTRAAPTDAEIRAAHGVLKWLTGTTRER
jgi:TrmH family RNA methyltransferase